MKKEKKAFENADLINAETRKNIYELSQILKEERIQIREERKKEKEELIAERKKEKEEIIEERKT
jgi:hypothetical protein